MMHVIRNGEKRDVKKVEQFLSSGKVSFEGVETNINYFLLVEDLEGNLLATLGIEPVNNVGILRSMVVKMEIKEEDLLIIFQHMYKLAVSKKLSALYLTTNNAKSIPLFQVMGFEKIERSQLPSEFEISSYGSQLLTYSQAIYMKKGI